MVSPRGYVKVSVIVRLYLVEVYADVYLVHFFECVEIYDRNSAVVIRCPVSAGIGDIQFVPDYRHFFGLVTHYARIDYPERGRVYLCDEAYPRIGRYFDGPGVCAYVCVAIVERDIAAVRYGYFGKMFGGRGIHDLHVV